MMNQKVWDKVLNKDEKVVYEFSIGTRYRMFWLIVWCLIGLILALGALKTGIAIILISIFYTQFYMKAANAYAFTNKRVLLHRGWFSTTMVSAEYNKITDVVVSEPILNKLFTKSGNLHINTAGSAQDEIVLKNIATPYEVKKKLDVLTKS